mgnify:FL=1
MNFITRIKKGVGIWLHYYVKPDPSRFGHFGKNASIARPCDLKNPQNIYLYDFARIGCRSTIITMGESKFIMKRGCLTAEGLVVVTSNHRQHIGQFLSGGNNDNEYKDIVVEEDVWIGINVTLLAGAYIGRGAIIGACSVVTKKIPPYAIAVGNPAKVIKFKWSIEEILKHESVLYPENERLTGEELEIICNRYK